jgi:hypothetical protein
MNCKDCAPERARPMENVSKGPGKYPKQVTNKGQKMPQVGKHLPSGQCNHTAESEGRVPGDAQRPIPGARERRVKARARGVARRASGQRGILWQSIYKMDWLTIMLCLVTDFAHLKQSAETMLRHSSWDVSGNHPKQNCQ